MMAAIGGPMNGVIQFIRSLFIYALMLAVAGTLGEATGLMGKEAAKAYRHGGVSFVWLNNQLIKPKSNK